MDLRELALQVVAVVTEAGQYALGDQLKPHDLDQQTQQAQDRRMQISSEIDERVMRFCHERIRQIAPFEDWEAVGSARQPGEYYWCIGHIDGSINYARNMPEWTITVSLLHVNNEGEMYPAMGIVHAPALRTTYIAAKGQGAIRIRVNAAGEEKREKIMPTTTPTLQGSVLCFGMSYFSDESHRALETVSDIAGMPADIKRIGPASMDLCRVADGSYDAYFEPTLHSWDFPAVSAAAVVVWEAQGRLSRWDGSEIVWGENNDIVASNGPITDALAPYLRAHMGN